MRRWNTIPFIVVVTVALILFSGYHGTRYTYSRPSKVNSWWPQWVGLFPDSNDDHRGRYSVGDDARRAAEKSLFVLEKVSTGLRAQGQEHYKLYSESKLRWLTACMARGDCPENADKVSTGLGARLV